MTSPTTSTSAFVLPQTGIFAQGTSAHHFLEFDLHAHARPMEAVSAFRGLRSPDVASGGVNLVLAFSGQIWRSVAPAHDAPPSLSPFRDIAGPDGRGVPAAQHDAWIWISGSRPDVVLDHARAATVAVAPVAALVAERAAFTYHDGLDMTGFIDGTANPPTRLAPGVAMIPPGAPGQGGSHVLTMRWVHDLDAFGHLPVSEQERVIGRTKQDSLELSAEYKPATAHIARVEIHAPDGSELPIYRRSVPYGTVAEHGLYFLAFSAERERFDVMLERMIGVSADGLHDTLTKFSRPVGAGYYFAPSLNALEEAGGPE
ncbi:MAG: porphyrinogen peroxidase [Gaiellales bacterium]|nr:porphyrinogen peroxidase [Gaiellales bacterium]